MTLQEVWLVLIPQHLNDIVGSLACGILEQRLGRLGAAGLGQLAEQGHLAGLGQLAGQGHRDRWLRVAESLSVVRPGSDVRFGRSGALKTQNGAHEDQVGPKSRPGDPKLRPRGASEVQNGSQEVPNEFQERPREPQVESKRRPGRPEEVSNKSSKTSWRANSRV